MTYKDPEKRKEYHRQYYLNNKENLTEYKKQYRSKNRDKINKRDKQHRSKNKDKIKEYRVNNREKHREYDKQYQIYNRQNKAKYWRNRYHNNIEYRIIRTIRGRIYRVLRNNSKSKSTIDLLGCSVKELKKWLESQFTKGMSWDNYGINGWEIDHIYPCSKFNLEQPYEQKICFNWFNLQPMWARDNRIKSNKLIVEITQNKTTFE